MYEIKVRESEFKGLLNRADTIADAKRIFSAQLDVMVDLTNYGTNLIPRAYNSSQKDLKDVVLIAILLRQVVAMLDAIEVLASAGAIYAAELQARALFEASVYMEWMLKGNTEKKANYYYVHNLRRIRRWALRMQSGTPEATSLAPDFASLPAFRNPAAIQEAQKTVNQANRILSRPEFKDINQAFDMCSKRPEKYDVGWYTPLGKRTIGAVIADLGKSAEYTVFYAAGSEATHASSYAQHVQFGEGIITFEGIRQLPKFESLFRFSVTNTLRSYRMILAEYRPGELTGAFRRKYEENWQQAFVNVPKVTFNAKRTRPAKDH